ncbi:MAG: RNA polymerase sigma factor [Bacteroidota bacterium]
MTSSQAIHAQERQRTKERFLALLEPVHDRLEGFAFAMTRDTDEGCDLVSETILLALEHFEEIRDPKAFPSYLFSIATRLHQRRRQRGKRFEPYQAERAEMIRSHDPLPDVSTDITLLYEALARLPEKQRETVVLHEIAGFPLKEIQAIQGGSLSAVKVRLWRARRDLATILGVRPRGGDTGLPAGRGSAPDDIDSALPIDLQRAMS